MSMQQKAEIFLTNSTNPHFNIALEEWLLKHYQSDIPVIFLWQNFNSIIIGRNQNTHLEVNQKLVELYGVKVARRLTGGGAVFQDKFNQCWTFIIKDQKKGGDYRFFATPILDFLNTLGVKAEFQGRNDLSVDGKKISGTAQMIYHDYTLCHGTILFDVDLEMMTSILTPNLEKLSSKGVDSVRKRVLNLKEVLPNLDFEHFQAQFFDYLQTYFNSKIKTFPQAAIDFATEQMNKKYATWEWNYGESKSFQFVKKQYFPNKGTISICFDTENNIIKDLKIYGDFLAKTTLDDFIKIFVGLKYDRQAVYAAIANVDTANYLGDLTKIDFINCMFN